MWQLNWDLRSIKRTKNLYLWCRCFHHLTPNKATQCQSSQGQILKVSVLLSFLYLLFLWVFAEKQNMQQNVRPVSRSSLDSVGGPIGWVRGVDYSGLIFWLQFSMVLLRELEWTNYTSEGRQLLSTCLSLLSQHLWTSHRKDKNTIKTVLSCIYVTMLLK